MAQRFTKLYELPSGCYAPCAPVMIRAGALLRDNYSKNAVVQLRLYNLDERTIRSAKLAIYMWDDGGQQLGDEILRPYTGLKVGQDEEFGQRTALVLPFREVASFTACVAEVVFADGTRWRDKGDMWEPIARPILLKDAYGSEEMASQFRIRYGTDCLYTPQESGLLWQCTCGVMNHPEEKSCHHCHRVRKALLNVSEDSLRQECEERLKNEALRAEEEAAEKVAATPAKNRKLIRGFAIGVPLALALAAVIYFGPQLLNRIVPLPVASPTPDLSSIVIPTPPTDPTPLPTPTPAPTLSPEEKREADYQEAVELLDAKGYSAARAAFLRLAGYKGSDQFAQEAVYRKAVALYEFIEKYDERDIYALLSMDPSGTNRFSLSTAKALDLGSTAVTSLRAACGKDSVDITMEDAPSEGLKPLASCVKEFFSLLADYKDSATYLESLTELTDYTRDFYMLCEAGDIYGAYDWLQNYAGEFPGRSHWLQLLDLYKPFCSDWDLFSGDLTLLPLTVGREFPCTSFNSRVMIQGDYATLRMLVREGESEYNVDLVSETGATNFGYSEGGTFYSAIINQLDHLAYLKFWDGQIISSCEYSRVY